MIGRFHGSAQRAKSILQSKLQNNFANYLNHRDYFQKYMQSISDDFDLKVDAFKMYGIVFSKSTPFEVGIDTSNGIYDYYKHQFEVQFWSKMKHSSPHFSMQEVNIYFPRFAKSIGIHGEKEIIENYEQLKDILIKLRKIYHLAMEYGNTRTDAVSVVELETSGFAELTGEFDMWSNKNGFKLSWGK